jgi:hypothetical protein
VHQHTRDTLYVDPNGARRRTGTLSGLMEDRVYIVRNWRSIIIGGFAVSVNEIYRGREYQFGDEQGFAPQRLRVLEPVRRQVSVPQRAPVRVRELVDA